MAIPPFEPARLTHTAALLATGDSTLPYQITATFDQLPAGHEDGQYDTQIAVTSASDPAFDQLIEAVATASAGVLTFAASLPSTAPTDTMVEGRAKVAGVFHGGAFGTWGSTGVVPLDPRPIAPAAPGGGSLTVANS